MNKISKFFTEELPEGATHVFIQKMYVTAGGGFATTVWAYKYKNNGLYIFHTDNDNEYPGWKKLNAVTEEVIASHLLPLY
jgi:hypothetical protein